MILALTKYCHCVFLNSLDMVFCHSLNILLIDSMKAMSVNPIIVLPPKSISIIYYFCNTYVAFFSSLNILF